MYGSPHAEEVRGVTIDEEAQSTASGWLRFEGGFDIRVVRDLLGDHSTNSKHS